MEVSLVLCTVNRIEEVDLFLESIAKQKVLPKEVIIVDQNKEGFLDSILKKWKIYIPIKYHRVNFKGVCRARNYGAKYITGNIVSFPDDDCRYLPGTIDEILNFFDQSKLCHCVVGRKKENLGMNNVIKKGKRILNILDIFRCKAETSHMFFRQELIESVMPNIFDINIGPGSDSIYISNDETDLLIRIFRNKWEIVIEPRIQIYHHSSQGSLLKTFRYALSRYHIMSKHELGLLIYCLNLIQPLTQIITNFSFKTIIYSAVKFIGRSGIPILFIKVISTIKKINVDK